MLLSNLLNNNMMSNSTIDGSLLSQNLERQWPQDPMTILSNTFVRSESSTLNVQQVNLNQDQPPLPDDGLGFSSDLQEVAPMKCFKNSSSVVTAKKEGFSIKEYITYDQLKKTFKYDQKPQVGWGPYSINDDAEYMNKIQDGQQSVSINYFNHFKFQHNVHIPESGVEALNEYGLEVYQTQHESFGITCGDNYISSYQFGQFLFFGLVLDFESPYDMEIYQKNVTTSEFNIKNQAMKIMDLAYKTNMRGNVSVVAYQRGGAPDSLKHILKPHNKMFETSCSFDSMKECLDSASMLHQYALVNFHTQENKYPNALYDIGMATWKPISELGLEVPKSIVTTEIQSARKDLQDMVDKNLYYNQNSQALQDSKIYRRALNNMNATISINLKRDMEELYHDSQRNLDVLFYVNKSGAECFKNPQKCLEIYKSIKAELFDVDIPKDFVCFQYHYEVDLPIKDNSSNYGYLQAKYLSTGVCRETAQFYCDSPFDWMPMTFQHTFDPTETVEQVLVASLYDKNGVDKIWSVTAKSPAYQLTHLSGPQFCGKGPSKQDPIPASCDENLTIYGSENVFYFDQYSTLKQERQDDDVFLQ